jgi:nucleoside-diphosphate-sugar epimerase
LRERGHAVAALCRRAGSEPTGTTAVAGDLTDPQALIRAFAETRPDAIIHLAAEIATQRDPARIREINVDGTQRLIDAALTTNRPKVVFTSTVVTGQANGALLDETSDLPVETAYGRSKQEGEHLLRASGLSYVVIRPSHIYGPGGWYEDEIVKRLRQPGRFAVVGSGENWWDVVRVEDVATACVDALERAASGATYHVVDDDPIRYGDFVSLTAKALGLGKPRSVPEWVARLAAGADSVRAVVRSAKSSNARIKSELGWSPHFPTAAVGVPDAVAKMLAA